MRKGENSKRKKGFKKTRVSAVQNWKWKGTFVAQWSVFKTHVEKEWRALAARAIPERGYFRIFRVATFTMSDVSIGIIVALLEQNVVVKQERLLTQTHASMNAVQLVELLARNFARKVKLGTTNVRA